jgi:hypothetical protein
MGAFLQSLWELIWGALTLNAQAFASLYEVPGLGLMAVVILALAAMSETIGQSIILFLNQISPPRFIISIILSVILIVVEVFIWTMITWTVARLLFDIQPSLMQVFLGIALGQAPFIFGFLVLIPYAGMFIRLILRIWTLLAVTVALSVLAIPLWQVLSAAIGGWLIIESMSRLLNRPLTAIGNWLWLVATGRRKLLTMPDLIDQITR